MNWLDVLILLLLAASTASGIAKGFARIAIGLVSTLLAIVLGAWFYDSAAALFDPYLKSGAVANVAGFFAVFGAVSIAGAIVAALAARLLKWAGLGWFDRLMGAAAGLARGALLSIAVVMVLMAFSSKPPPPSIVGSSLAPYFVEAADTLVMVAPTEMKDAFRKAYELVKKAWSERSLSPLRRLPAKEI